MPWTSKTHVLSRTFYGCRSRIKRFTKHHHRRICSVVAIGGASKMIVNDAILEGLQNTFEATVDSIVRYSWHKKTGAVADSPQMAAFFREKAKQRMLDAGSKTVFGDFLACSRFDLSKRVGEIVVPVLVIASDCDRMVPLDVSWEMSEVLKILISCVWKIVVTFSTLSRPAKLLQN